MFYRMRHSFEDDPTGEILIASDTKTPFLKHLLPLVMKILLSDTSPPFAPNGVYLNKL